MSEKTNCKFFGSILCFLISSMASARRSVWLTIIKSPPFFSKYEAFSIISLKVQEISCLAILRRLLSFKIPAPLRLYGGLVTMASKQRLLKYSVAFIMSPFIIEMRSFASRYCQIVLHSDCTKLHSSELHVRFLFAP